MGDLPKLERQLLPANWFAKYLRQLQWLQHYRAQLLQSAIALLVALDQSHSNAVKISTSKKIQWRINVVEKNSLGIISLVNLVMTYRDNCGLKQTCIRCNRTKIANRQLNHRHSQPFSSLKQNPLRNKQLRRVLHTIATTTILRRCNDAFNLAS